MGYVFRQDLVIYSLSNIVVKFTKFFIYSVVYWSRLAMPKVVYKFSFAD